jgi:hypothetical protein
MNEKPEKKALDIFKLDVGIEHIEGKGYKCRIQCNANGNIFDETDMYTSLESCARAAQQGFAEIAEMVSKMPKQHVNAI